MRDLSTRLRAFASDGAGRGVGGGSTVRSSTAASMRRRSTVIAHGDVGAVVAEVGRGNDVGEFGEGEGGGGSSSGGGGSRDQRRGDAESGRSNASVEEELTVVCCNRCATPIGGCALL